MNIYIGIDSKEVDKFKATSRAIAERLENDGLAKPKSAREYTAGEKTLCLLFSNNIKYIEKFVNEMPCEVINVTDNLSSSYIIAALKYVKDIYYLKSDLNTIMDRLATRIRLMENNAKVVR